MSQKQQPNKFSETQEAIFNFFFVLVEQYKVSMPHDMAIEKACDWLISFANDVKAKNKDVAAEQAAVQKKLLDSA